MTLGPVDPALDAKVDRVTRELRRRGGDWLVRARRDEGATHAVGRDEVMTTQAAWIEVVAYDDGPRGRGVGAARASLEDVRPAALVAEAVTRARLAPGAPWQSPPAAGPARVELAAAGVLAGTVEALAACAASKRHSPRSPSRAIASAASTTS